MRTVTLPIEEYNELLQDQEDKKRLLEELEADAKDRGFFVQKITQVWDRKEDSYGWTKFFHIIDEMDTINIISKDEVLSDAQREIDRLAILSEKQAEKIANLKKENLALKNRGFFERLFNKNTE